MPKSTILVKHQTTVPKQDHVRVTASSRAFLELRGSFKVGPGDPVEDLRKARERMGTEEA